MKNRLRRGTGHLHPVLRLTWLGRGAAPASRVGFLPWHDPRVRGTVAAVRRALCHDHFALRYDTADGADGLPGAEGEFLACSFWLVDALHGTGEHDQAQRMFEHLLEPRNDVGLLSEEFA